MQKRLRLPHLHYSSGQPATFAHPLFNNYSYLRDVFTSPSNKRREYCAARRHPAVHCRWLAALSLVTCTVAHVPSQTRPTVSTQGKSAHATAQHAPPCLQKDASKGIHTSTAEPSRPQATPISSLAARKSIGTHRPSANGVWDRRKIEAYESYVQNPQQLLLFNGRVVDVV